MADTNVRIRFTATDQASRKIGAVSRALGVMRNRLAGLGVILGGAAVVGGIAKGIKTFADYEAAMKDIDARVQLTEEQFEGLNDEALRLSQTTLFKPTHIVNAMLEMVTAGQTVEEVYAGLPAVLNLTAATGNMEALKQVTDGVTNTMKIFQLGVDDTTRVTDLFAQAAALGGADVFDLMQTMERGGPVLSALGIGLEDALGMAVALGEQGLYGAEAGTSMKSAFLNLIRNTEGVEQALRDMGVTIDETIDPDSLFEQLAAMAEKMGQVEFTKKLQEIFGSYGITGASALLNQDISEIVDAFDEQATAAEVAAGQQESFEAKVSLLGSSLDTLAIKTLGPLVKDYLEPLITGVTDLINNFITWNDEAGAVALGMSALKNAVGFVWDIGQLLWQKVGELVSRFQAWNAETGAVALAVAALRNVAGFLWDNAQLLWQKVADLVSRFQAWNAETGAVALAVSALRNVAGFLWDNAQLLWQKVADLVSRFRAWNAETGAVALAVAALKNAAGLLWDNAQLLWQKVADLVSRFQAWNAETGAVALAVSALRNVAGFLWDNLVLLVGKVRDFLPVLGDWLAKLRPLNIVLSLLKNALALIWAFVKPVWENSKLLAAEFAAVWEKGELAEDALQLVKDVIDLFELDKVVGWFGDIAEKLGLTGEKSGETKTKLGELVTFFAGILGTINPINLMVLAVRGFLKLLDRGLPMTLGEALVTLAGWMNDFERAIHGGMDAVVKWFQTAWNDIKVFVNNALFDLLSTISGWINNVLGMFEQLIRDAAANVPEVVARALGSWNQVQAMRVLEIGRVNLTGSMQRMNRDDFTAGGLGRYTAPKYVQDIYQAGYRMIEMAERRERGPVVNMEFHIEGFVGDENRLVDQIQSQINAGLITVPQR